MELDIFSHQRNIDFQAGVAQRFHHGNPVCEIRLGAVQLQTFAGHLCQMFFLHGQRGFIEIFDVQVLQNMAAGNITEQSDFVFDLFVQRQLGAADNDVGADSHSLQFFYTGLGGLGLHLLGSPQVGNQGYMDQNGVFVADFLLELPDRLQKWLAFNIAHRSTNLYDGDAGVVAGKVAVKPVFDFVSDVGDDLDGSSAEISPPFFGQYGPVNFTCGYIGIFVQALVNESFIVPQVQVCLSTVVCDKNFSVLHRIHCARVNVDIGVKFLHGDFVAAGFQQTAQRCCCNSFSQAGNYTAGYKNVFNSHISSISFLRYFSPALRIYSSG